MSPKKFFVLLLLFLACSTTVPVFGLSSVTFFSQNKEIEATLTIVDAFYTDLDDDEVLDIVAFFNLRFSSDDCGTTDSENDDDEDKDRLYKVLLFVRLTLPSGYRFSYRWYLKIRDSFYSGEIDFYDHATESGIYKLSILAILITGGISYGIVDYDFDPPGGSGGGDPLACLR